MSSPTIHYVNPRVLKLNVGHLLAAGPGHSQETGFDIPALRLDDELLVEYVRGPLRLTRTKEGILVQGRLEVGLKNECYRCLDPVLQPITVEIEELYSHPASFDVEFIIHEDAILDLAPLLRAEVLIDSARGVLCREDCKGLCRECGANLNYAACDCDLNDVDPRLAGLQALLNESEETGRASVD